MNENNNENIVNDEIAIKLEDVHKSYGNHEVLKGLNLQEGVEGILFITTTKRKDGSLMIHCAGFLPKEEEF